MPPDRYPPSYSDTPGACPQVRHKPLSSPTAVPRVRSCPCRITLHLSAKSPFHGPEAIQRTSSTASRCKRDSAALRTAAKSGASLTAPSSWYELHLLQHRVQALLVLFDFAF